MQRLEVKVNFIENELYYKILVMLLMYNLILGGGKYRKVNN